MTRRPTWGRVSWICPPTSRSVDQPCILSMRFKGLKAEVLVVSPSSLSWCPPPHVIFFSYSSVKFFKNNYRKNTLVGLLGFSPVHTTFRLSATMARGKNWGFVARMRWRDFDGRKCGAGRGSPTIWPIGSGVGGQKCDVSPAQSTI